MKFVAVFPCLAAALLLGAAAPEEKKDAKVNEQKKAAVPENVPEEILSYEPEVIPGARPRIFITPSSLEEVRAKLTRGENAAVWNKVLAVSAEPYAVKKGETLPNLRFCNAVTAKAMVFLMNGDKDKGLEAVKLLTQARFAAPAKVAKSDANQLQFAASVVYDWCHDLLTPETKKKLQGLVGKQLIGSIALYGDDNLPYKRITYGIFEQKDMIVENVISTSLFRAWLFRRMAGKEVLAPDSYNPGYYAIYSRLPDGSAAEKVPAIGMFLAYTYSNDPLIKHVFEQKKEAIPDPVLYLLLNDPDLKSDNNIGRLPLAKAFGGKRPAVVARTGWNIGKKSTDTVLVMRGWDEDPSLAGTFRIVGNGLRVDSTVTDMTRDQRTTPVIRVNASGMSERIVGAYAGPGVNRPFFSYLWTSLPKAHADHFEGYRGAMCFVHLDEKDCPGVFLVVDHLIGRPQFAKTWSVKYNGKETATARGVDVLAGASGMSLQMFLPKEFVRIREEGKPGSFTVANKIAHDSEIFAAVMRIGKNPKTMPEVACRQNWNNIVFTVRDRMVVLPSEGRRQDVGFRLSVPEGKEYYTLIAGLQAGLWNVCGGKEKINIEATVQPDEGVIFVVLKPGEYLVTPGASADEIRYVAPQLELPEPAEAPGK